METANGHPSKEHAQSPDAGSRVVSQVGSQAESQPAVLFVTTVPITLKAFLLPFADHFRDRGYRVDALAHGIAGEPRTTSYGPEQARVTLPHFDATFDIGWTRSSKSFLRILPLAARVRAVVVGGHYDIVHVHTPIAAMITRFALRNLAPDERPCVIYTTHGFHFFTGQDPLAFEVYHLMEKRAARWTDELVTVNEEDFSDAVAFGTIEPAHVHRSFGIGVDTQYYSPFRLTPEARDGLRAELGVGREQQLIIMVAEFSPVKRHHLAFEALAYARQEARGRTAVNGPERLDPKLLLVGEGPLEEDLRRQVAARGIEDDVIFAGYRDDVADLLCASDLGILTSEREGLPRSILEALACGIPVVGTMTRGISDAIGDAKLISGYKDPHGLARIITDILGDRDYHESLKVAARERALDRFALESVIAFYDDLYERNITRRQR